MRISDLAEALLRDYKINKRKSLKTVQERWRLHLKPYFEEIPAEKLTTDQVEDYIARRLEEQAAEATINRELAALKRMYNLGLRAKKLALAECPYIPHLRESNTRQGFVRDQQYQALARETGKTGLWLRALFEVAYTSGARKSELLGLKVAQVNLEERVIQLDSIQTKNGEPRKLPLTGKALELVSKSITAKQPQDYVFTREEDRRGHKPRNAGRIVHMTDAWNAACCAAGLGKMLCPNCGGETTKLAHKTRERSDYFGCAKCGTARLSKDLKYSGLIFHDLRRTGVRNMRRSGISEKIAMRISGHKTRLIFDRYDITDQSDLQDAVVKMEQFRRKTEQLDIFEQAQMFPEVPKTLKPN